MAEITPLPKWQLFIICLCRFADTISFFVHLPFIYFMVKDFNVGNSEGEIGFYISLLLSSFSIAQFISAIPWGLISDTYGRKPIILVGQLSSIIGMFLFGLSKTYIFAITVKTVVGLMNGNISIFKTMISEITINNKPEQRAQAFSVLQIIFGIGCSAGVFLSVILSDPVKKYPFLFEHHEYLKSFFSEYPFFLPCFMASFISFIGFIMGLFYLNESLATEKKINDQNETTPLLSERQESSSYSTVESHKQSSTKIASLLYKLKTALTPSVSLICFTYGIVALQNVYYDELFVIWTPSDKKHGGLEMSSSMIGLTLMLGGFTTLFTQLFLFHHLIKYFGTIRVFQMGLIGSIIIFFLQSLTGFFFYLPINDQSELMIDNIIWAWISVGMIIKTLCQTVLFTSVVMLISDVAPVSDTLATIYGFSQCCSSSVRAIGPILCGTIWSLSISIDCIESAFRSLISWVTLILIAIIGLLVYLKFKVSYYRTIQVEHD